MTLTNAEKLISSAPHTAPQGGLARVLKELGSPEKKMKIIKVFGESGKSSTASLLSSVLCAAGYKAGRLVTPIVHSTPRCICIFEKPIPPDFFTEAADRVKKAINAVASSEGQEEFTVSSEDLLIAISLVVFDACGCDIAVLEIPNDNFSHSAIEKPLISVVTTTHSLECVRSICARLDRMPGEVITAVQRPEIHKAIIDKCAEINARFTAPLKSSFHYMSSKMKRTEFTYKGDMYTVACGAFYQVDNLLTVYEATEALRRAGLRIYGTDICSAVLDEGIPLRFETVSVLPTIIIDRADSEPRLEALLASLKKLDGIISKKLKVICDEGKIPRADLFSGYGYEPLFTEIPEKGARKALSAFLKTRSEEDVMLIIGSSAYCEQMAKITKEILM